MPGFGRFASSTCVCQVLCPYSAISLKLTVDQDADPKAAPVALELRTSLLTRTRTCLTVPHGGVQFRVSNDAGTMCLLSFFEDFTHERLHVGSSYPRYLNAHEVLHGGEGRGGEVR